MITKLPTKFIVSTKYARAEKYTMERHESGLYHITEEDGKPVEGRTAKHTEVFVLACLNEGSWILEKDLEEREMVFPFTVYHEESTKGLFEVTTGSKVGQVTCTYIGDGDTYENVFSVEDVKGFIKEGIWIVKHVGEKAEQETPQPAERDPQAIYNNTINQLMLTIEVESSQVVEATTRVNALAQALENVNIAMESYMELVKEMKGA